MSTRNQKKKAGASVVESENDSEANYPRVCSVVMGEGTTAEPGTSMDEFVPLLDSTLEILKTSLRTEITEEVTSRERPTSAPYLRLKKTRKPLFLQLETTKALKKLKSKKEIPIFFDFFSKFPVSRILPKNVKG